MNSPRATAGADLAADLMADLNALPAPPGSAGTRTLPRAAVDRPPARGPALQLVLRVEPRGWHWPSLRVNRGCVSVRLGAMSVEASTRPS